MHKLIVYPELAFICRVCENHTNGTIEGDTSFEEHMDIYGLDLLEHRGKWFKFHDRSTGDILWASRIGNGEVEVRSTMD